MIVYDRNLALWYRDLLFGKYSPGVRGATRPRDAEPVARLRAEARQKSSRVSAQYETCPAAQDVQGSSHAEHPIPTRS